MGEMMWKSSKAKVESIYIAKNHDTFVKEPLEQAALEYGGIPGDLHFGLTKLAGAREPMYPRHTKIFNRRQITIVSMEECAEIAELLGIETVLPQWLGANMAISGFSGLTALTEGSRIVFPSGAGLVCEGENLPCIQPGEVIQSMYPSKLKLASKFVKAAYGRRGIICTVECRGPIAVNDLIEVIAYHPPQLKIHVPLVTT
jgi:MOSC domain-containing protein YiiM